MPRVSVTLPKDIHDKLYALAEKNDDSFSNVIAKMAELGYMVKQNQSKKSGSGLTEVEEHCLKLTIQMNAIIKDFAEKKLDYDAKKFTKLRDITVSRFNELAGIEAEEL